MNLVIDPFRDKILLYNAGNKKIPDFWYKKDFDYSLEPLQNQQKALTELVKDDDSLREKLSKGVNVVIPDDGVGFGMFDLPPLSRFKLKDVFNTRFKSSYPNFESFNVNEYEYERNANGALYFYTFCKKERILGLSSALKGIGSSLLNVEYYASAYAFRNDPKALFPHATLFLGKKNAELILTKGRNVLYIHEFGYGYEWLNRGADYIESAYLPHNDKALQFSSFATENFAKKVAFSDENIEKTASSNSFVLPSPKEVRIMKGEVLTNYLVRNAYRKFYALIADVASRFAGAPWFLPINVIDVVSEDGIAPQLNAIEKEEGGLTFNALGAEAFDHLAKGDISQNPLFNSGVKKERRKFDWKKLLTMEIGKKKA